MGDLVDHSNNTYTFWKTQLKGAKLIVAPMVDQSELPWRLLSRRYGAELCYTPMLHASVFIRDSSYRKEALASCAEDKPLIVQFCANDPDTLLKAAKLAEDHCDAIDLNLGCPQAIARRGHYGAFLQDEWPLLQQMICASELKIPITAKIRVYEDIDKTVQYAQMLEKAGVKLLTVHGRTKEQKGINTGLASWEHIKAVKDALQIPVFANGNIQYLSDVHRCVEETGVEGVMVAEGNLHNPGLFDGKDHIIWEMANEYLDIVEQYPCSLSYVRGHVFKLFQHALQVHKKMRDELGKCQNLAEIRNCVELMKKISQNDIDDYSKNPSKYVTDLPFPYWICQPYVRPDPEECNKPNREKIINKEKELEQLKRTLSSENVPEFENLEDLSKNQLKKLKRNHRKIFITKSKDEKYPKCACGNPKGQKCEFDSCRACCKERAFKEKIDCPGHKLIIQKKQKNVKNGQIVESSQSNLEVHQLNNQERSISS